MSRFTTTAAPSTTASGSAPEVTVGIDFGTSSTKVAFREFGGLRSVLVCATSDQIAWPSVAGVSEGRLLFGVEAERLPASRRIRWMKMLLAVDESDVDNEYREEVRRAGRETACSMQCLTTLYLAQLLARVQERMAAYFRSRSQPKPHLTINMGAPLETFSGGHSRPSLRFEEALYWARELADSVPAEGWTLEAGREAFEAVVRDHPYWSTYSDRTTFVVPETHAAVTGAIIDRKRLPSGNYVVVDIGAGTTDVAIFSYSEYARKDGRWAVTYLADAVKHEASVQADRCISELVWETMMRAGLRPGPDAEMLEQARELKEQSTREDPVSVVGVGQFSRRQIEECVGDLKRRLFDHYKRTLITAMRDKTKVGLTQPFSLLMLGGGSCFTPLHSQFVKHRPSESHAQLQPQELWGSLKERVQVLTPNGQVRPLDAPADHRMFSLVHGLTTHLVRLGGFWTPGEVADMPAPPPADLTPYVRDDDT